MMVEWVKELPTVVKAATTFLGGVITASGVIIGAIWGPISDHEMRIRKLEDGNSIMVCWIRTQINGTDPTHCLFDSDGIRR